MDADADINYWKSNKGKFAKVIILDNFKEHERYGIVVDVVNNNVILQHLNKSQGGIPIKDIVRILDVRPFYEKGDNGIRAYEVNKSNKSKILQFLTENMLNGSKIELINDKMIINGVNNNILTKSLEARTKFE